MGIFIGLLVLFFFFKQKTAYEMRISDWSSDVCSSYLAAPQERQQRDQAEEVAEEGDLVGGQRIGGQADRDRHGTEEGGAADHQQGGAGVGGGGHRASRVCQGEIEAEMAPVGAMRWFTSPRR